MADFIKPTERFLLTAEGKAVTQDAQKEGPEFAAVGGRYFFMKLTEPEVPSLKSGDEVWVVNEGVSFTYWTMPNNELRATQDQKAASRFALLKVAGAEGVEIRHGDAILMATAEVGQWIGLTVSGQQLMGWPTTPKAQRIVLQPLGTPTLPPPVPAESDWCIRVYSYSRPMKKVDFHGTREAAYQRKEQIRAGTPDYAGDDIKSGRC